MSMSSHYFVPKYTMWFYKPMSQAFKKGNPYFIKTVLENVKNIFHVSEKAIHGYKAHQSSIKGSGSGGNGKCLKNDQS